jgi:hypothetical protein
LTEFQARRLLPQFITDAELQIAQARARPHRTITRAEPTFREMARAWLAHLETVEHVKPSTLRDYRSLLAEPEVPYRRVHLRIAIGAVVGGRVVASSGVHAVTWVGATVVSISVGLASINALGTRRARLAGG